ncbi:TetR/AcrR family transcriptional regulator [Glycomyces endophyticus]|uniref:TetR/AcrR family transcriptional regulator n=1 Tax=Glycomyces endophyticus TaxID=480996 RepID=A0ABN2GG11_9ACTN
MPRHLDREARLREVSEAAWRVLARDGLAELSVRNVAAEAGLAPSSLRYVFPTQSSLRERATDLVVERMTARVARVPADAPDRARALLLELLPLDADRRIEMEAYLALGTAAMTEPDLRGPHLRVHNAVRAVCDAALRDLARTADTDADRLHALVDGLALHIVRQDPARSTAWAIAALDAHLTDLRPRP